MITAALLCLASLVAYYVLLSRRSRGAFRNIRGPPASSFLYGNLLELMSADAYGFHADLAQNYGSVVKLHAMCGGKHLYVFDSAAMHSILVHDEPIYNMPEIFLAANRVMFGPCLVSTSGSHHRRGRKIMNPVFSLSRLREMLPMLYTATHELSDSLSQALDNRKTGEIDMLKRLGLTSLEFIGRAGFGHSFAASQGENALEGMKQLLFAAKRLIVPMQLLPFFIRIIPAAWRRRMIDFVPLPDLHLARDLVNTMDANSRSILAAKRHVDASSGASAEVSEGKDILSVLLRSSMRKEGDTLSEEELLGQMNVLIFAGTDTTSTAVARALQELARSREIQDRLRDEITSASVHGDLDYDALFSLPLLDAVCRETLRLYPPATMSSRQAMKDTILPPSRPMNGINREPISEIHVPAGTIVHIGIRAANTNRAVWGSDALDWKPSRWLEPLPQTVLDAQFPGVYPKIMSFIGGPRGCIGFKFAEMAIKVLLAVLLKDFMFSLSDKEIIWKMGQAEAPSVEGKQALPLIVTPVASLE
ncbi:cytochrome P450 [Favolaschia claudopus]|uniref:Cytochrome P450 n=1 Tax=Favolaschia claudopus TaxID=2862362 RepID=A0AAW0A1D3_9AGAR